MTHLFHVRCADGLSEPAAYLYAYLPEQYNYVDFLVNF